MACNTRHTRCWNAVTHIQQQVQPQAGRLDKRHHLRRQGFKRGVAADRGRPAQTGPAARAATASGSSPSKDRADAPVALRHQNRAQQALADSKADVLRRTPRMVLAGPHAQHLERLFVKPAAGLAARAIDGIRHRVRGRAVEHTAQPLRTLGHCMGLGVRPVACCEDADCRCSGHSARCQCIGVKMPHRARRFR